MNTALYIFIAAVSYFLGSVSLSILMSRKLYGVDVRTQGSGNAGATNMARVYGWSAGILTFLADAAKAGLSMLLGWYLLGEPGLAVAGICCMTGHCYPAFYKFKGGKGVSVGAVVALMIDWRVGLLVILTFAVVALGSKKVSPGSVCAAAACGLGTVLLGLGTARLVLALFCMCLVIFRHSENIKRLIKGTEPNFKPGKSAR